MNGTEKFELLLKEIATRQIPLCIDSRKAVPGSIFVAMHGTHANGAVYIADAIRNGASTIVCPPEDALSVTGATVIPVTNPRLAAARLAAARWNTDSLPFPLVGVTGTNGKTTCTYLLEHLFTACGKPAGVIGTIAVRWPGYSMPASMTTPDIPDLHSILASMRSAGVQAAAMEVSSHALDQDRAAYIPFSSAVFTNLTQDHLDYHKTFEAYYAAKARLFLEMPKQNKSAAVGTDGSWGRRLAADIANSSKDTSRLI
ncbi:MAG: UDP-N-acetylmuramoyl-L-alanyl-D-glutamate--2,6-diaminopimelate ligase, partial [Deltaproteobacteria bacterium]|nr:UDP-N-acetylmuramoyl-L-alanyl-D-glutamate--2,6-diaminopimelate ligase [Deltaproteobacteria bacterium]